MSRNQLCSSNTDMLTVIEATVQIITVVWYLVTGVSGQDNMKVGQTMLDCLSQRSSRLNVSSRAFDQEQQPCRVVLAHPVCHRLPTALHI